jgi:peptidoglycan/xylan/chitin deacetylase (PgdA/CDA1 family)
MQSVRETRSWRKRARSIFDSAARATLLLSWFERRMRSRPTILMYHRVLPDAECRDYPFPSLVMPVDAFEQQVAWLSEHCDVVTAGDPSLRANRTSSRAARPKVAITFDDGYADNYEFAAQILERHGVRGTFFVVSDFVAANRLLWYDHVALLVSESSAEQLLESARACGIDSPAAAEVERDRIGAWVELLKRTGPAARARWIAHRAASLPRVEGAAFRSMRPADVADLARRGHEIGSHSVAHEILPLLDDESLSAELQRSRAAIAEWTGGEVPGFCYPNGSHDERVVAATRAAGYAYACTTLPPEDGPAEDPLRLPRVDLAPARVMRSDGRFDLLAFRAEISGLHRLLR